MNAATIMLVDADSFFCACERLFNPALNGRAVVTLSNNDGNVVARSREAKMLGVAMGEPFFKVRARLGPDRVIACSPNFALYGDISRRVLEVVSGFAESAEAYSIDESFLEFSPGADLVSLAATIRRTVWRHVGIPVSIGVAPTKVLAKAAIEIAKAGAGIHIMDGVDDALLAKMKASDVWGIGDRLAARLGRVGVQSALDLKSMDSELARRLLSVVGQRIVYELRGISCLAIEEIAPARQAMGCARGFGRPVDSVDELLQAMSTYLSRLGEKLRKQGSVCDSLTVFISTDPFRDEPQYCASRARSLPTPTDFTPSLLAEASALLRSLYRPGYRYKRVGVMLAGLHDATAVQQAFDSPPRDTVEKRSRLMATVDGLNSRFGATTVRPASAGGKTPSWGMRASNRSPRYTTRWNELRSVRCDDGAMAQPAA